MARDKKSAYGAPQEGKEVVVSVDKRLFYGLGLVLAFVIAIGFGMVWAQLNETPVAQPLAGTDGQQPGAEGDEVASLTDDQIMATALADGMPTTVTIVGGMESVPVGTLQPELDAAAPGAFGGLGVRPNATVKAAITPVSEMHEDMLKDPKSQAFEIDDDFPNTAAGWAPDVLANFEDPNVTDPDYAPLRLETVEGQYQGPRLAIGELNELNTYNFGVIPIEKPALHEFTAKNVGDEDLLISRVYSACGCTATRIGDVVIDPAGFIKPSGLVLKPGETVLFGVEFDPRAEGVSGSQAKYVQVFSNDPTSALFDAKDENSHETRFRLVVAPE